MLIWEIAKHQAVMRPTKLIWGSYGLIIKYTVLIQEVAWRRKGHQHISRINSENVVDVLSSYLVLIRGVTHVFGSVVYSSLWNVISGNLILILLYWQYWLFSSMDRHESSIQIFSKSMMTNIYVVYVRLCMGSYYKMIQGEWVNKIIFWNHGKWMRLRHRKYI